MLTIQHHHYIEPPASPIPKPGRRVAGELHQNKNKNKNKNKTNNKNKNKNKKATSLLVARLPLGQASLVADDQRSPLTALDHCVVQTTTAWS